MTGEAAVRRMAAGAVLLVAAIAAVISFTHIQRLALTHGQSPLAAGLLPLSIDGTVAAASAVMLRAAWAGRDAPWLARVMLGAAVAATLAANVANGARYGAAGALLSGWPAVAFTGCAEMAFGMVRSGRRDTPSDAGTAELAPPAIPAPQPGTGYGQPDMADAVTGQPGTAGAASQRVTARRTRDRQPRHERRTQADIEAEALAVLSRQPGISGAALGRTVGVSGRTGQRLAARLAGGRQETAEDI